MENFDLKFTIDWNRSVLFDGRIFTFSHLDDISGMQERNPEMWKILNEKHPEVIRQYIIQRLKGEL